MSVDKIWVLAEVGGRRAPSPLSLELITQARALAGTVEAVAWGADTASVAGDARRVRGHHRPRRRRSRAVPSPGRPWPAPSPPRWRPARVPMPSFPRRPTTAGTSPDGSRSSSTGPC